MIQTSLLGEANMHVGAVFSLAKKLRDANNGRQVIIFLDEVDGLLGNNTGPGGSSYYQIQTEFLQLWSGLGDVDHMILLAATNSRDKLSDTVMRRFSYVEEVLCFLKPLAKCDLQLGMGSDFVFELRIILSGILCTCQLYCWVANIDIYRGEVTDTSAETKTLGTIFLFL